MNGFSKGHRYVPAYPAVVRFGGGLHLSPSGIAARFGNQCA